MSETNNIASTADVSLRSELDMNFCGGSSFTALTPENFNEMLLLHKSKPDSPLAEQFKPLGDLFFCQQPQLNNEFKRIWIIDADDTLWEDNIYYEQIIAELTDYAVNNGVRLQREEIRKLIDDVEHEIIPHYGFGAEGFAISMRVAWDRLRQTGNPDSETPDEVFNRIGPLLGGVPYVIPNETVEFLQTLRLQGSDCLVLFTQGPIDVQLRKISNSGLAPKFHAIAVGKNKAVETYSDLISRLSASKSEYIVVGNSLNSEILPAVKLGFRAFHYSNPNSWHSVNSIKVDQNTYTTVTSLTDIFNHL